MNRLLLLVVHFSITIFSAIGQNEQIAQVEDLIDREQYEKGLEIIDQVISKHPTNIAYYYKAYCEQQKMLFEAATVSASLALKITTKTDTLYTRLLFLRCFCYAHGGKLDLAIADNETLLKQFPNDLHYLLNMSFLYGENQQFGDCMKTLQKAITLDSSNISILSNLSYYSNQSSNYGDAINIARRD